MSRPTDELVADVQAALEFLGGRAVMIPGAPAHYRNGGIALAELARRAEEADALRAALEEAAEFLGSVTEFTGASGEELAETCDVVDRALAATKAPA